MNLIFPLLPFIKSNSVILNNPLNAKATGNLPDYICHLKLAFSPRIGEHYVRNFEWDLNNFLCYCSKMFSLFCLILCEANCEELKKI